MGKQKATTADIDLMNKQDADNVWGHYHNCFACKFSYLELDERRYYCSLKGEPIGTNYELCKKNECKHIQIK